MKYFGILDPKTVELTIEEINELLVSKGLFVKIIKAEAKKCKEGTVHFEMKNATYFEPIKDLKDAYYEFIINLYQIAILEIKLPFFKKFNDEIYGLEPKEQKTIGLKHFKEIYNTIYLDTITFFKEKTSDNGISETQNIGRFEMLNGQYDAFKTNLFNDGGFFYYLIGDKNTYLEFNYKENVIFKEVLEFEAWKQIIVELNSRYGFEEDNYFGNNLKVDKKNDSTNSIISVEERKNIDQLNNSTNSTPPFVDYIRHGNKIEIEQRIKLHYSNLRGVSLRYLIEFLKEEGVLILNHGDVAKFYCSIKTLFEGKDIAKPTSIFDKKVFSPDDPKYIATKISFAKMFKDIL